MVVRTAGVLRMGECAHALCAVCASIANLADRHIASRNKIGAVGGKKNKIDKADAEIKFERSTSR
jgi:hypothetical protein